MSIPDSGASNNERLLAAARSDSEELIQEVFDQGGFDINHQDGMGNTALHYAASLGSTTVLEYLLSYEGCDVDIVNRVEGATPLHVAAQNDDSETRYFTVKSLLEAGSLTTMKNKYGEIARDLVPIDDEDTRALFKRQEIQSSISRSDIVDDDEDEDGEYSEDDD
ncbi:hypothetical protein AX15_001392 [Amanita polypyramis BW_CC]|nr:hypothetical protein AX15_001392 [Amanita polypyramis BW_CC]